MHTKNFDCKSATKCFVCSLPNRLYSYDKHTLTRKDSAAATGLSITLKIGALKSMIHNREKIKIPIIVDIKIQLKANRFGLWFNVNDHCLLWKLVVTSTWIVKHVTCIVGKLLELLNPKEVSVQKFTRTVIPVSLLNMASRVSTVNSPIRSASLVILIESSKIQWMVKSVSCQQCESTYLF